MGKKKRVLSLLMAAIFMLSFLPPVTVANAEGVPTPIPKERLELEMAGESDGLICTVVHEDGKIDIMVTDVDWENLFFSNAGYDVRMTMRPPNDDITHYKSVMGGFSDSDLEDSFADRDPEVYPSYGVIGAEALAQVKETLSGTLVIPRTTTNIRMAVQWFDDPASEPVMTEIYTVNIRHVDTSAHYITVSVPSEDRVHMNTTAVDAIRSEYIAGTGVNYFATNCEALEGQIVEEEISERRFLNIVTKIDAPPDAVSYDIWLKQTPDRHSPVTEGGGTFSLNIVRDDKIQKGHIIASTNIYWYDADGELILQETLRADYYYAEDDKPWPEVGGRWMPLDADRIREVNAIDAEGVNMTMTDGLIEITFDKNTLPDFSQASLKMFEIIPPEGAVKYKTIGSYLPMRDGETTAEQDRMLKNNEWILLESEGVESPVYCIATLALSTKVSGSPMTVYYSTEDDAGFANTLVIDWGLANGDTVSEYLFVTTGKFGYVKETAAVGNEAALTAPVNDPTIISENDWTLRTEYIPQSGENSIFYEFSLKDEDGKFQNAVESGVEVVLPFPDGMTFNDAKNNHAFTLRHYNADLDEYELITLEVKEYGLTFTATGFSPYMVMWGDTVDVTFDTNGGSPVDSQTVTVGSTVGKPGNPTLEGRAFCGWYADEELTTKWDFENTVNKNITLYAKWGFAVTFDTGDGSLVDSQAVGDGEKADRPYAYRWGYAIQGWYIDEDFAEGTEWDFGTHAVSENTTLYAKWEKAIVSVTITNPPDKTNYTQGDKLSLSGLCINAVFDTAYDEAGWPMEWGRDNWVDDDEIPITVTPADGTALTTANTKVTVTVMGKSAEFSITVKAKSAPVDAYAPPVNPSPNTVTDQSTTKTGASATGAIPPGAVLTVGELSLPAKGENAAADAIRAEMGRSDALVLVAKDIKLSKSFTGKLTITLPIDAKYNGQTVTILHDHNGTLERYTAVVTNGQVVFEVTSLSPFVVLLYATAVAVPNTGAPAGIFPFALLALSGIAGITAAARRKRKQG